LGYNSKELQRCIMNGMQENYHVLEMWVLCTMAMNPPATWAGLKLISKKPMVRFKDNIRIMVDFHCLTLQYFWDIVGLMIIV